MEERDVGRLIGALQKAQRAEGYLSRETLGRIAAAVSVPPARAWGVATFYDQFRFHPPGRHAVRVCCGTACHLLGSEILLDEWRRRLGIEPGETTADREFSLDRVACVGCCTLAPVLLDGDTVHGKATPTTVGGMVLRAEMERRGQISPVTAAGDEAVRAAEPASLAFRPEGVPPNDPVAYRAALADRAAGVWRDLSRGATPTVWVGGATCGRAAGSDTVLRGLRRGAARSGSPLRIVEAGCLGHCYAEPLVVVRGRDLPTMVFGHLTEHAAAALGDALATGGDPPLEYALGTLEQGDSLPAMADGARGHAVEPRAGLEQGDSLPAMAVMPRFGGESRRLLRRCGIIDPVDLDQYVALGGYAGLARALTMRPHDVIAELDRAGLRGLGGAGFPAARKWRACVRAEGAKRYVVANGDEGDPGAFMDRTVMESDPHAVIEGMILAGYAIGAVRGFVYVRAEYPLAVRRMTEAIARARAAGILGRSVLGTTTSFEVDVVQGAGAFVCGESTALMRSLEGRRGIPRVRPPRSTESGLLGRPTVLNNVKTFAAAALILERGAAAFAAEGTPTSRGTAVFALAGKTRNPGLVEVPMGTTLRRLIFDIGGGVPNGRRFKAVQIGGPSGGCLPEALLDTPVDFDSLAAAGAMMGSGGMVILDEEDCMVETARFFMEFTHGESCGKCTFCREGSGRLRDLLERITAGDGTRENLVELERLSKDLAAGSACNLGKTAPNPVLTTLRYFRDEFEAHVFEKRCPARVCRPLVTYRIDPALCARGCDVCVGNCPVEAITEDPVRRVKRIDMSKCVKCRSCARVCPAQYHAVEILSPAEPGVAAGGGS